MSQDFFKVPKTEKPVTLWVHPEGKVKGSLYVREQSLHHIGEESPYESLNQTAPFVVIRREQPEELRFYHKSAIIRVEYTSSDSMSAPDIQPMPCEIHMMDGSMITGNINTLLVPGQGRLYDYLNKDSERFVKLEMEDDLIYLINKNYIIYVRNLDKV